jgi:putative nucleotidyltransferase with HDIG domain
MSAKNGLTIGIGSLSYSSRCADDENNLNAKGGSMAKLEDYLPEVNEISDPKLREMVCVIFDELLSESSWNSIDKVPANPDAPERGPLIKHLRGTTQIALSASRILSDLYGFEFNTDYIIAGGLLHDAGKILEYSPSGKTEHGKFLEHGISAVSLGMQKGLPLEILHIISSHSPQNDLDQLTIEAFVVRQGDVIDVHWCKKGLLPSKRN